MDDEGAETCADVLITNDMRGVETHGVSNMLRRYVADYQSGVLNARPDVKILRESPTMVHMDADGALGIHVGPGAMKRAIAKAKEYGMGVATVANAGHLGGAGYHATLAARAGMLGHGSVADRFLPDKAMDLLDEAASRLRIENASVPAELDELRRRIMQLEIEREALKLESGLVEHRRPGTRALRSSHGVDGHHRPLHSVVRSHHQTAEAGAGVVVMAHHTALVLTVLATFARARAWLRAALSRAGVAGRPRLRFRLPGADVVGEGRGRMMLAGPGFTRLRRGRRDGSRGNESRLTRLDAEQ